MTVLSEPLVLAAPQGTRALRGKAEATLKEVADLPLIIFPRRIAPALHDAILGGETDFTAPNIGRRILGAL